MNPDPPHIVTLEQALAESPDNRTLRLYVAQQHLSAASGRAGAEAAPHHPHRALQLAQELIADRPDDIEALVVAAGAAKLTGATELADRYARLVDALGGGSAGAATDRLQPDPPTPLPSSSPMPSTPDATVPDDLGAFDVAGPAPVGPVWSPDGSHDDIPGETPLYVTFDDDAEDGGLREIYVPDVRLADVGGLESVKRRLQTSFLAPLQNPELRAMYRKSLRGGMLLYGPPGCGKTFLARAVAGELQARFFNVGLHEVLDMYLGNSEKKLHEVFVTARRYAPCVLFLDEIDALGFKRSNFGGGAGRNVVVQLLNELDGLRDENEGLFVIGATNQPWDIDSALRRPGRFDRMLLVLPPDEPARRAILEYHLRDRPVADNVDVGRLAAKTDLYSGADLRLVCESAAEVALEDSLASGIARVITQKDLERSVREVHPSTRAWFETAKNYAQFANEGGRYDDLLDYLRSKKL